MAATIKLNEKAKAAMLVVGADLLKMAVEKISNSGCNDFCLDNTPENYALIEAMLAWSDIPLEKPDVISNGKEIITYDWLLMSFLAAYYKQCAAEIAELTDDNKSWQSDRVGSSLAISSDDEKNIPERSGFEVIDDE